MRPAGVAETVQVTGDLPAPIATPVVGINLTQRRDQQPGDAADASGHRAALARRQRELAEREPAGHQRSVRVRQRVHGQRRRRQRQPVRDTEQSLHRGRDRGDAGPDVRHLGRVRPVHRRRGQRHHQERRQQFFGQRPDQFPEQRLDDTRRRSRNASTRMSSPAPRRPTTSTSCRRPTKARSAARSCAIASGSSCQAATSSRESQSTLQQTGIVVPTTDSNKRGEIKITGTVVNNHTLQWRVLERPAQAHQQLRPPVLHHRSAQRGRSGEPELVLPMSTTGACWGPTGSPKPSTRSGAFNSRATAARARTSPIRRFSP